MRTLLVSADLTADEIPVTGGHRRFVPGLSLKSQAIAPGRAALPPTVREAHLKNEDMTRKKLAFSMAYTSFFFAQELAF